MADSHRHPRDREVLRAYLADRDAPCPVCAYNLRDLDSDHCPECGAAIRLSLRSTDLKVGPWLVMLLGVSIPLGFCLVGAVFVIAMLIAVGETPPRDILQPAAALTLGAIVYGLLAWFLVKTRRFFLRRHRVTQLLFAIGFVFVSAVIGTAIGTAIASF